MRERMGTKKLLLFLSCWLLAVGGFVVGVLQVFRALFILHLYLLALGGGPYANSVYW